MQLDVSAAMVHVPNEIAHALGREYAALESRFARGDWSPAELSGGRLAEAILRYLEWKSTGTYTAVGSSLNRSRIMGDVRSNISIADGIRLHVSSCTELLMDIRNRRDVAHIGAAIDVNEMDAHLVLRVASWSLAEILREESGLTPSTIQEIIDRLSVRRIALVEEVDGKLVVVATGLKAETRALVTLYHSFPDGQLVRDVQRATKYKNSSRFKEIMKDLDLKALVHLNGDNCVISRKGVAWVEKNVSLRLDI